MHKERQPPVGRVPSRHAEDGRAGHRTTPRASWVTRRVRAGLRRRAASTAAPRPATSDVRTSAGGRPDTAAPRRSVPPCTAEIAPHRSTCGRPVTFPSIRPPCARSGPTDVGHMVVAAHRGGGPSAVRPARRRRAGRFAGPVGDGLVRPPQPRPQRLTGHRTPPRHTPPPCVRCRARSRGAWHNANARYR